MQWRQFPHQASVVRVWNLLKPAFSQNPKEPFIEHMIKVVRKLKKISCEVAGNIKFIIQKAIEPNMQQPINNNTVSGSMCMPLTPAAATSTTTTPLGLGLGPSSNKMSRALYAHKLRTHTNKLKQQTNKIMSNLKGINQGVFFSHEINIFCDMYAPNN